MNRVPVRKAAASAEYRIGAQRSRSISSSLLAMDHEILPVLKHLLILRMLITVVALPTLGYIDRHRLETYEDLSGESNDMDLFGNLTFQFSCEGRPIGLYGDPEYECRIFHACDDSGRGFPVICPNNTLFDQRERVCVEEEHVDCGRVDEWYYLNELPYSVEVTDANDIRAEEKEDIPSVLPLLAT